MASNARSVLTTLKSTLAAITVAGGYVHTFTDRVYIGAPTPADGRSPPMVWIWLEILRTRYSDELGSFRREMVINVEARVPRTAGTTEEGQLIGTDALDDILTALQANRTLTGTVLDCYGQGVAFDGEECGIPGSAVARAQFLAWWEATSTEGV